MITALVHYTDWVEAPHPQLDDIQVAKSKVVKVEDLTELNDLFSHITKVDFLEREHQPEPKQECKHQNRAQHFSDVFSPYESCKDCGKDL